MLVRVALVLLAAAVIGVVAWRLTRRDPAAVARPPAEYQSVAEALEKAGLPNAEELAALSERSVRITTQRVTSDALPIGASRFGGAPDVPADFEWPARDGAPLTFLAQLELSQLSAPALPTQGWLLFFYDAANQPWGFDPKDAGGWSVLHLETQRDQLKRATHPKPNEMGGPFELSSLRFDAAVDLPDPFDSILEANRVEIRQEHFQRYFEVAARLSGANRDGSYHHLLGHPQLIQNDMRGECQLVTNGISTGNASGYDTVRAKELLLTAPAQWRLLLQIDTDEEGPGWMWGDVGRIYFWIRHDDLAARRFEKTWVVLQCS